MKKIDSICRNFLWGGKDSYLRSPNVSWEKCCTPKEEGGLGLKNAHLWNKALLGKYTDWLASKKDHLWVKWVHHVYMKGDDWQDYNSPSDCSWSWKKIIHVKNLFKAGYSNDSWQTNGGVYTVSEGYSWLRNKTDKVSWRFLCWNTLNVPKTSFIFWAIQHQRLLTLDRMQRMGIGQGSTCYICGLEPETHSHLFYESEFSKKCIKLLQTYLHIQFPAHDMVTWFSKCRGKSGLQRLFTGTCFVGVSYAIWNTRNTVWVNHHVPPPWVLVNQVCDATKIRWKSRNQKVLTVRDQNWIDSIGLV